MPRIRCAEDRRRRPRAGGRRRRRLAPRLGRGPDGTKTRSSLHEQAEAATGTVSAADLRLRFAALSRARSNQCGLLASALASMPASARLQESCCSRMEFHRYIEQGSGLRQYGRVELVPRDPYDIPVALAKRLLGYQKTISLTPGQQETYDRAVRLSHDGGPCCCRCWRWSAFEGQAKFLIARRGYDSKRVAEIWDLEDGCGGPGHVH